MEKEKLKKQVKSLNDLLSSGKIKESEFESLVIQGYPSKAVEVWKDAWEVARMVSKKRNKNIIGYDLVGQILVSEAFEEVYEQKSDDQPTKNNSVCENCLRAECLCKSIKIDYFDKTQTVEENSEKQISGSIEEFRARFAKVDLSSAVEDHSLNPEKNLTDEAANLRGSAEKLGLVKLKNPVFKRVEDKSVQKESKSKIVYDSVKKVYTDGKNGPVIQVQKSAQCTDCGSPERDMTELKATLSVEKQKEVQRQIKLGETIQFQNQIKIMTDHMKDPGFKDFYKDQYDLGQGEFFEIQRLFDWAMERTPTATVEIKELAELLQACEDWHANDRVRKSTEYVEWFKQRIEWLEDQKNANAKVLQGYLSDNDSLLDGLKKKNPQLSKEIAEMISNDIKYSTLPDGSKIKEYYREGVLVRTENDDSEKPLTSFQQSQVDIDNKFRSSKGVVKKINPFKYVETVEEDNFTATPVDVKGTDGPFRRKLSNKIESNVVEKQDRKDIIAKDREWKSYINSSLERLKKKYKPQEISSSDNTVPETKLQSEPMFDLSFWQKTKVYFRDLKNKASTLFKSPEITEEEVDRAIRLMEKQIAEIKKSKNVSPELFEQAFDCLLPRKDRKYYIETEEDRVIDAVQRESDMKRPIPDKKLSVVKRS